MREVRASSEWRECWRSSERDVGAHGYPPGQPGAPEVVMLLDRQGFSSFSTDNLESARRFYGETLGLDVGAVQEMGVEIKWAGGGHVFIYPKGEAHQPASFTVLNFPVDDLDGTVEWLVGRGVTMELYEGMDQDAKGIMRSPSAEMGPDIAWFKDPAGNVIAVMKG